MTGEIEYRLLGPLEARAGGELLPLGRKQQRAVLAQLLVRGNRPVSSDELIEALWPENAPASALNTIQGYVSGLRKVLGSDAIATTGGGYLLRVDGARLDSLRFEQLARAGREALENDQPGQAAATLVEALSSWRGAALADFAYEAWAQPHIGRLEELRLAALEDRIEAELQLGRGRDLVAELEALVEEHPLRERFARQLMLSLYAAGRQADALAAYRAARERLVDQLGVDPSPDLVDLQRKILNHDAALLPRVRDVVRSNLPLQPTPLIGRGRELRELEGLVLRADVRLVTLTGSGGTGKTRLALQAAAELMERFPDGVWFVNLAALTEPALVLPTIAQTLAVKEQAGRSILDTLIEWLGEKRVLLVLDNFEQVADAADSLAALLGRTAQARLLVTSRVSLHLSAEHEYPVPTLAPEEALAFFTERARAAKPSFALNGNRPLVAEICRRLDHLPLALELAAARIKLLPEQALLERLDQRLKLLTGGARDLPARQQTLRATIDWSYSLLTPEEQRLFARLAVFAGGRTLDAIEAVCNIDGDLDTFDAVASLVDKNLLRQEERQVEGEPRYVMLETVREFAFEELERTGDAAETQRRHLDQVLILVKGAAASTSTTEEFARLVDVEYANVRAALAWSRDADPDAALSLASELSNFWDLRGVFTEGRRWINDLLERVVHPPATLMLEATLGVASLAHRQADYAAALAALERGHHLAVELNDDAALGYVANTRGIVAGLTGETAEARAFFEEGVTHYRKIGDQAGVAWSTANLVRAYIEDDELDAAEHLAAEASVLAKDVGSPMLDSWILGMRGRIAAARGELDAAESTLSDALRKLTGVGAPWQMAELLEELAIVATTIHDDTRAGILWGGAQALREELGAPQSPAEVRRYERVLGKATEQFVESSAVGRTMVRDEIVAYALSFASRGADGALNGVAPARTGHRSPTQ